MECLQSRLDSFSKTKRVKNPSKPSSNITLKWPHPESFKATPDTLAEAGFYYDPSADDPDNVTCFMCEKELGGWEEDDDPFDIHYDKCSQKCGWANTRCGLRRDMDRQGRFVFSDKSRLPASKGMEQARLETFTAGDGWIHDGTRGHGANSKKQMARAGFVATPNHPGDDLATCLYCHVSLSGWDKDDDPLEEHRKRKEKMGYSCPFFANSDPPASDSRQSIKPSSKASTSKPPSRTASKSKLAHQDMVMPTKTHDGDPDGSDYENSDSAKSSTSKTPARKPRSASGSTKKSTAKTPQGRKASRSLKNVVGVDESEEPDEEPPATVKKKKTTTRARSKSVARSVASELDEVDEEEAVVAPPTTVKKKGTTARARSKSVARSEQAEQSDVEEAPSVQETVKKPSRAKGKSKAKAPTPSEVEEDEDQEDVAPRKSSRTRNKSVAPATVKKPASKSRGRAKVVEPEPEVETVDEDTDAAPTVAEVPKPRTTKKPPSTTTSKAKGRAKKVPEEVVASEDEFGPIIEQPPFAPAAAKAKPSSTVKKQPLAAASSIGKGKPPSSRGKSVASPVPTPSQTDDDDELGGYVPQAASPPKPVSTPLVDEDVEMTPLVIPKRTVGTKLKKAQGSFRASQTPSESSEASGPTRKASRVTRPSQSKPPSSSKVRSSINKAPPKSQMKVVDVSSSEDEDLGKVEKELEEVVEVEEIVQPRVDLALKTKAKKKRATEVDKSKLLGSNPLNTDENSSAAPAREETKGKSPFTPTPVQAASSSSSQDVENILSRHDKDAQPAEEVFDFPESGDVSMQETDVQETQIVENDIKMQDAVSPPAAETEDPPRTPLRPPAVVLQAEPDTCRTPGSSHPIPDSSRPTADRAVKEPGGDASQEEQQSSSEPAPPPFFPPLSKLPFVPLQELTEAELDMTVEEWIRYQTEVEFDKFRRDGERELQRFRKRAEEARKVIEGL
ncbi:hypothetical protein MD484_g4463, partial [Candolleomyces efflorescens]